MRDDDGTTHKLEEGQCGEQGMKRTRQRTITSQCSALDGLQRDVSTTDRVGRMYYDTPATQRGRIQHPNDEEHTLNGTEAEAY